MRLKSPAGVADEQINKAASEWAEANGYKSLGEVKAEDVMQLVASVAKSTQASEAKVQKAYLQAASRAKNAHKLLQPGYQGAQGQRGLDGSPTGTLIAARTQSLAEDLADDDKKFLQTMADIESTRVAITDNVKPKTLDELVFAAATIQKRLATLERHKHDTQVKEEIISLFEDLLSRLARERGVYIVKGTVPEATLSPPKNVALFPQPLGVEPKREPLLPKHSAVLGEAASLGVDSTSGQRFVFDVHGEVKELLSLDELVRRRQSAEPERIKLPAGTTVDSLRSLDDKQLERLGHKITYVPLKSDDPDPMAWVYPTKWHRPQGNIIRRRVICAGPMRGIYLDDLVNAAAIAKRRGYTFDPEGRTGKQIATKGGEPFVTSTRIRQRGALVDRLYVRVPYESDWTEMRRALRRLTEINPNIQYVRESKNTGFYFPPESYKLVRDVLKSMVLDERAMNLVNEHFKGVWAQEAALDPAEVRKHSAEAIGGFKRSVPVVTDSGEIKSRHFSLNNAQMRSLSWLQARDYRGVVALDTGMGKTLAAIGAMLERIKQGEKRPFLLVVPKDLRGNFAKEIHKFLEPHLAEQLLSRIEEKTYAEMAHEYRDRPLAWPEQARKKYGAVIFDEAQALNKLGSTRTRAALALKHPHTLCLTASPMEKAPTETYIMSCVAQGINLADRAEGREHRWRMRKFQEMTIETLGGRALGIKQKIALMPDVTIDPRHELLAWVRQNVFWADKEEEQKLPELTPREIAMPMKPGMEERYRRATRRIARLLRGMVSLYRDKGKAGEVVDPKTGRTTTLINPLARLRELRRIFGSRYKEAIGRVNNVGNNEAKLDRAAKAIWSHLAAEDDPKNPTLHKSRAILFSDSPDYVEASARRLSEKIPGKVHAACLGNRILLFQDGEPLKNEEVLKRFPGYDVNNGYTAREYVGSRRYSAAEWQQFVLNEVLAASEEVTTSTMLGPSYSTGQNFQWANIGIHLDRDTWNSQNMRQREARLWRQGQEKQVFFYTLDWTFRDPLDTLDATLDEIRKFEQLVGEGLFAGVIEDPQHNDELGDEWTPPRDEASLRQMRFGMSPTLKRLAEQGAA